MTEPARPAVLVLALALFASGPGPTVADEGSSKDAMLFAADMARKGSWREARFRWERVARSRPDDPRVLNNLAVAQEVLGETAAARDSYVKALALAPGESRIEANRSRFESSRDGTKPDGEPAEVAEAAGHELKGKAVRVTVHLPVPPRLDTTGYRTLLVASFLAGESSLLEINRELVHFLRSKLGKDPDLQLLNVTPAPAVPEQTLADLAANREFWKHLGQEYGADLIVSGAVSYERRDHSGFQEVDRVHPTTGQKVRQTEFVEQEKFSYTVDLLFLDGNTGEVVYRDRLQRSAIYRGTQNDPITAFYDLSESLAGDVMAIVEPRTREDVRIIFKS